MNIGREKQEEPVGCCRNIFNSVHCHELDVFCCIIRNENIFQVSQWSHSNQFPSTDYILNVGIDPVGFVTGCSILFWKIFTERGIYVVAIDIITFKLHLCKVILLKKSESLVPSVLLPEIRYGKFLPVDRCIRLYLPSVQPFSLFKPFVDFTAAPFWRIAVLATKKS